MRPFHTHTHRLVNPIDTVCETVLRSFEPGDSLCTETVDQAAKTSALGFLNSTTEQSNRSIAVRKEKIQQRFEAQ